MQQQQQLQQLGFLDDLKKFGRDVGQVGKEINKKTGKVVDFGNQIWKLVDENSHSKYSGDVNQGINQGVDISNNIFDFLKNMKQQQQMQVLLIWDLSKSGITSWYVQPF